MRLALLQNSSETGMLKALVQTEHFTEFNSVTNLDSINENDVLIVCSKEIDINQLSSYFQDRSQTKHDGKIVFYLLNEVESDTVTEHITSICETRKIDVIPPMLTENQIVEKVIKRVFPDIGHKNRRVVTFYGADRKVGSTMVSLCVAQKIAQSAREKVLYISIGDTPVGHYLNTEEHENFSMDEFKVKLFNKMLSSDDLLDACIKQENLYILQGPRYLLDIRHYYPEHLEYIIDLATSNKTVDLVIIDAGSNIERGMTIGALRATNIRYLVTTQLEVPRKEFERIEQQILRGLQIRSTDFMIVVNKYVKEASITANSIADVYRMTLASSLPNLEFSGWQAEIDKQSLNSYATSEFDMQIQQLCRLIANQTKINLSMDMEFKKKPGLVGRLTAMVIGGG